MSSNKPQLECIKRSKSKEERFKCLAEYRTNEVLKKIRILGNCSNRSFYSYSEEEIEKIFTEIESALSKTKVKFTFSKKRKFKL